MTLKFCIKNSLLKRYWVNNTEYILFLNNIPRASARLEIFQNKVKIHKNNQKKVVEDFWDTRSKLMRRRAHFPSSRASRHLALYIIVVVFGLLLKYFLVLQYFIALGIKHCTEFSFEMSWKLETCCRLISLYNDTLRRHFSVCGLCGMMCFSNYLNWRNKAIKFSVPFIFA